MPYVPGRKAAELLGVHQNTLREYADAGRIPHIRTASGQRRYDVDAYLRGASPPAVVCYCRVSSSKQRDDLERQVEFMRERYPGAEIVRDVGGGLNWKRKGLVALLERLHQGDKLRIVVAHRDRLARFGFEVIQWMAERNGGELVVLDNRDHSPEPELTQDLLAILHTFSCRLPGLRRYRQAIQKDPSLSDHQTEGDPPALV